VNAGVVAAAVESVCGVPPKNLLTSFILANWTDCAGVGFSAGLGNRTLSFHASRPPKAL
jgi:hypothetical protein